MSKFNNLFRTNIYVWEDNNRQELQYLYGKYFKNSPYFNVSYDKFVQYVYEQN